MRQVLTALAVGAVLAAALSYPTIVRPGSVSRQDGDGRLSVWNVAWIAHSLVDDPRHLVDANIFYPHTGALSYSEPNLVAGLMAAPVYALTRNPLAAHNVVVYVVLVLAFVLTWALVRRLTGSASSALVAAAAFAFAPYIAAKTAHIQLLMLWVFPLVFLAFHRLADGPSPGRGAILGAALAVAALSCGYYGIFAGLALGVGAVWFAFRQARPRRYWLSLAVAVVVAGALVGPVLGTYLKLRREQGAARVLNVEEARGYSADLRSYVSSTSWAHESVSRAIGLGKEILFPGVVVTLLAMFALWHGGRIGRQPASQAAQNSSRAPFLVFYFYVAIIALAFWVSLGPDAGLYTWLSHVVPFMSFLRAPARFGVLVVFGLAVIAGFGLARLQSSGRHSWLTPILLVGVALDVAAVPWDLRDPGPVSPAYRELAKLPRGGVIEFHFPYKPTDLHRHTRYMYGSIWHWQPIINGYTDFIPPDFREMTDPVNGVNNFPDPGSFRMLRDHQARYVVIHWDTYGPGASETLRARFPPYLPYLRPIVQTDDVWLLEIVRWPE
jgi:hypothetical protein